MGNSIEEVKGIVEGIKECLGFEGYDTEDALFELEVMIGLLQQCRDELKG